DRRRDRPRPAAGLRRRQRRRLRLLGGPVTGTDNATTGGENLRRVCFVLKVRKDRLEEYKERHAAVWPEMRTALSAAGWHNYSLFCDEEGMVIGYLETEDFDRARAAMAETEVNARWQ